MIHFNRPLNCQSCCFPCCLQYLEVSSPPGTTIGSVEQEWTLCEPQFAVRDAGGEVVLRIEGPLCTFSFCGDVEFKVLSADGSTEVRKHVLYKFRYISTLTDIISNDFGSGPSLFGR